MQCNGAWEGIGSPYAHVFYCLVPRCPHSLQPFLPKAMEPRCPTPPPHCRRYYCCCWCRSWDASYNLVAWNRRANTMLPVRWVDNKRKDASCGEGGVGGWVGAGSP